MKMTLADGSVLEGTAAEMREYSAPEPVNMIPIHLAGVSIGDESSDEEYDSASRGWMRISEMHTLHIKNALLKMCRDHETNARRVEFVALVNELANRAYAGMRDIDGNI